jgi:hypothetical protein
LAHELRGAGLDVVQKRGRQNGVAAKWSRARPYFVDLTVEQALLVGLKTASAWNEGHGAHYVNDLKASGL